MQRGVRFRMLDASGRPKIYGYILGAFSGQEPLSEYGRSRGCVGIEYQRDGIWERLEPEGS